jgi:hypothetical protein
MTLEDETGIANLIVRPELFDRQRRVVLGARLMGIALPEIACPHRQRGLTRIGPDALAGLVAAAGAQGDRLLADPPQQAGAVEQLIPGRPDPREEPRSRPSGR